MSVSTRAKLRRLVGDQRGATALEFAFVAPIFLGIMLSVFEFGWAQHKLSSLRFAMETASRGLLLNPALTEAQLSTTVKAQLNDIADPDVAITLLVETQTSGKVAKLTGVYTSHIGVPLLATYPIQWTTTVSTALPAAT